MLALPDEILPTNSIVKKISLVVPVYNEEGNITPFLQGIIPVLESITPRIGYNILFVNDGSRDKTKAAILAAASDNSRISLINLSRNFGKEAALFAGLCHAQGDAIIPVDVDLQDPPHVITDMIERWRLGAKVVNARRVNRDGDTWMKRRTAQAFYRVFNTLSDHTIPHDVGDFRLLDREVVDVICRLGERSRFNKALFSWVGFETDEVQFERPCRTAGTSTYSYWKLWKLSLDGIFSSSTIPLRMWSYFGAGLGVVCLCYSLFILIRTLIFGVEVPGYASTLIIILIFGSLNIFALGIIGEYVARIYTEVRQRPVYIVSSRHNVTVSSHKA